MASITLPNAEATMAHAESVAAGLQGGEIFALCGDLGAGKTHWTKGLAKGLGSDPAQVTSPTFTLLHEYLGGRLPLFHFDLYRLESPEETLALGLDEYLGDRGVCVIEWANKFPELLPAGTRWLHLQNGEGETRFLTETSTAPA